MPRGSLVRSGTRSGRGVRHSSKRGGHPTARRARDMGVSWECRERGVGAMRAWRARVMCARGVGAAHAWRPTSCAQAVR
eukprot:4981723-Prymnesium_polylepis.1